MFDAKKTMDSLAKMLPPPMAAILPYYLRVAGVSIAGLAILLVLRWIARGYIQPFEDHGGNTFIPEPTIYLWSIPFGFLFWVYALREERRFPLSFSRCATLLSILGFVLAASLPMKTYRWEVATFALLGCIASCFIFINFKEFFHYAFRDRCKALIAFMAMGASAGYAIMDHYMWQKMAFSAASTSQWVLQIFGFDIIASITKRSPTNIATTLSSENFTILVYQPCSGLEGIFLFIFLLSIVILLDWKIFKHIHFIETYLIGFLFMYLANVLRISSLFLFGHYAHAPDASPLLASMRGMPVHIFHSFIGQLYYLLAFMLFAHILYAYVIPPKTPEEGA